jgi:hypothetical protein
MDLRSFIEQIASAYDRIHPDGYEQPAQVLISDAPRLLQHLIPLGFRIGSSGQKPFPLPVTPWIGFRDPDESSTFMQGIYVVYIFSADLANVYLSVMQGTEKLKMSRGMSTSEQLIHLHQTSKALRSHLDAWKLAGLRETIDLRHIGGRPATYEAGNIVAIEYDCSALPPLSRMEDDLGMMLALYDRVMSIRDAMAIASSQRGGPEDARPDVPITSAGIDFNPKSDSDYVVQIEARTVTRSRRHETLVRRFGEWAATRDFMVATPHPLDLWLVHGDQGWVVEAKIARPPMAESVRMAIGQLVEYRRFLRPAAGMIALFDRPVGDAYVGLLDSLGIGCVWWDKGNFVVKSSDDTLSLLSTS